MAWRSVKYKDGKYKTDDSGGSSSHTYSTDEQDTGDVWIDGKPIYEKTFVLTNSITVSNTTWTSIGFSASSINAESYIRGFALTDTGTLWDAISVATIDGNISLTAWRNGDTIGIKIVVIRYTKTTD